MFCRLTLPKPQGCVPLPLAASAFSYFCLPPSTSHDQLREHTLFTVRMRFTHTHIYVCMCMYELGWPGPSAWFSSLSDFLFFCFSRLAHRSSFHLVDRIGGWLTTVCAYARVRVCVLSTCVKTMACVFGTECRYKRMTVLGQYWRVGVCGWGLVQRGLYCIRLWLIEGFMLQMGFWWGQASIFLVCVQLDKA